MGNRQKRVLVKIILRMKILSQKVKNLIRIKIRTKYLIRLKRLSKLISLLNRRWSLKFKIKILSQNKYKTLP